MEQPVEIGAPGTTALGVIWITAALATDPGQVRRSAAGAARWRVVNQASVKDREPTVEEWVRQRIG